MPRRLSSCPINLWACVPWDFLSRIVRSHGPWIAALSLLVFLIAGLPSRVAAQLPSPLKKAIHSADSAPPPAPASSPSIEEEIADVKRRLAAAQQAAPAQGVTGTGIAAAGLGISQSEIDERQILLTRLPHVYEHQLATLEQIPEVRRERADLEAKIAAWHGFAEKPPYAVEFVDGLRENAYAAGVEAAGVQAELDQTLTNLSNNQARLEKSSQALRLLSEQVEQGGQEPKEREALLWRKDLERLRGQFIGARVAMNDADRRLFLEQIELANRKKAFAERQVSVAAAASPFSQGELDRKLEALEKVGRNVRTEVDRADADAEQAARRLTEARGAVERAKSEEAEGGAAPADTGRLQDELRLRQVEDETARIRLDTLKLLRDEADGAGVLWRQRFVQSHSRRPEDLTASRDLIARVQRIVQARRLALATRLDLAQSLMSSERDRAAGGNLSAEQAKISRAVLASYEVRAKVLVRGLQAVANIESLIRDWESEIAEQQGGIPLSVRIRIALEQSTGLARKIWNFELFSVQDVVLVEGQKVTIERGVTVGKIILAILILSLGIFLTVRLGRLMYRVTVRRFKARESVAALVEKCFLVLFSVIAVVVALTIVRIPLTVFAFLGGALAIGAGFGAQNLINNFISGIILLVERPIKVGDLVDVEGVRGRVVRVGSRCCRVRRYDGIDLLIPNSAFLEKNVINWTLTDPLLRFSVEVGVAYGSPTEQVRTLLEQAVTSHPKVLQDRSPMVLFEAFGDNALQFAVYFWLALDVSDNYRLTLSDLRFEIDRLFREAGITIAFPQRDVHLSGDAPLEVRLVDRSGGS